MVHTVHQARSQGVQEVQTNPLWIFINEGSVRRLKPMNTGSQKHAYCILRQQTIHESIKGAT